MSKNADALRRKTPPQRQEGPAASRLHSHGGNEASKQCLDDGQRWESRAQHDGIEGRPDPTPFASQTSFPSGRPKPARKAIDVSNNQVMKRPKKPKPTLRNMCLADVIPKGSLSSKKLQCATSSRHHKPEKNEIITASENCPSLISRFSNENRDRNTPALLPSNASWARNTIGDQPRLGTPLRILKSEPKRNDNSDSREKTELTSKPINSLLDSFRAKPREESDDLNFPIIRQRKHPRKKKFSTLKKKVLQERLQKWRELHPEEHSSKLMGSKPVLPHAPSPLITASSDSSYCTVCLLGFVQPDDIEDEDEFQEIMDNLNEMAQKIGPVRDLFIPRQWDEPNQCPAFVLFTKPQDASAGRACWDGLVVGGQTLKVSTIATDATGFEDTGSWRTAVLSRSTVGNDRDTQDAANGTSIVLRNLLTPEDFEDNDCLQESLSDIHSMAEQFGTVSAVEASQEDCSVVVRFLGGAAVARSAVQGLDGVSIGGMKVSVTLSETIPVDDLKPRKCERTVVLTNVLTSDDMDDDDCLQETLENIKDLASKFGIVSNVKSSNDDGNRILVTYVGEPWVAKHAADQLDRMILGGQAVSASLLSSLNDSDQVETSRIILRNLLTEEDMEDEECLEECKGDVAELASQYGKVISVTVEVENTMGIVTIQFEGDRDVAEFAAVKFDGMLIGGNKISAVLDRQPIVVNKQHELMKSQVDTSHLQASTTDDTLVPPLYSGGKLIPDRFAECKRVPKIPNSCHPKHYATIIGDETVTRLLTEMLGELMRVQQKAAAEKNTKAPRRLVMGLREVARGIRTRKVKMVVMANNLDDYGAIDVKLQEILDLANDEDVPVLFELNKRKLGKAVGKNMKIGVVGVQSAEGADNQFKKLTAILARNNQGQHE